MFRSILLLGILQFSYLLINLNGQCSPALIEPAEGAFLDNGCYNGSETMLWNFVWDECQDAERYELYVIGPGASIPSISTQTSNTSYTKWVNDAYISESNQYGWIWRVRAMIDGEWGSWSERTFNVEPPDYDCDQANQNTPPDKPQLLTPSNGIDFFGGNLTFSWLCDDSDDDPLTYALRFSEDGIDFEDYNYVYLDTEFLVEFDDPFRPQDLGTIYWKIIATDGNSETESDIRTLVLVERPTIITADIIDISDNSASSGGQIIINNDVSISSRGVCWSTSSNPNIYDSYTQDGSGAGSFTSSVTGLLPTTRYYLRSYAIYNSEVQYGDQVSFFTISSTSPPVVSTGTITNITSNSAESGGEIISDDGSMISSRGVCWSTAQNPTVYDSHTVDGSGAGSFTSNVTGLLSETNYYLRAYAIYDSEVYYGGQGSFFTLNSASPPDISTGAVNNITSHSAESGGEVVSNDGFMISSRGVCWSISQNPTVYDSHTVDGSGTGSFTSSITGLLPETTYYLRAYAIYDSETFYGDQVSFLTLNPITIPSVSTAEIINITSHSAESGGSDISDGGSAINSKGVCWSVNQYPTISNYYTSDGSGSESFNSVISGLSPKTKYYVRAYASNTLGVAYGEQFSFNSELAESLTIELAYFENSELIVDDISDTVHIESGESVTIGSNNMISGGKDPIIIQWEPTNSLNSPNIQNPLASPDTTTTYTYTVFDGSNCSVSGTVLVIVDQTSAINDHGYSLGEIVFPNPTRGELNIKLSGYSDLIVKLDILSTLGQVLFNDQIWHPDENSIISYQLDLPPGVYILNLFTDNIAKQILFTIY